MRRSDRPTCYRHWTKSGMGSMDHAGEIWHGHAGTFPTHFCVSFVVYQFSLYVASKPRGWCSQVWYHFQRIYRSLDETSGFWRTWTNVQVHYMLSPVRLSSVCNLRAPYSAGWNFRQFFYTILWYLLGHPLTSMEILRRSSQWNPIVGGFKRKRGSQI